MNAPLKRGIFFALYLKMKNNDQHEKFMKLAIQLSEQNVLKAQGGPFGAVIVKDGKIIAKSANKVTTTNDPTAHAEVSAIRSACKKLRTFDLTGCIVYTSCEPCPMCLSAIYWAKIERIYYANTKQDAEDIGFSDKLIYDELEKPINQRSLPISQMMRNDAQTAFKLWDQSSMRTEY